MRAPGRAGSAASSLLIDDDLAARGQLAQVGDARHRCACDHVAALAGRVANHAAQHRAGGNRDAQRQLRVHGVGDGHIGKVSHSRLQGDGRNRCPLRRASPLAQVVGFTEPTGDGVAAETDDTATVLMHGGNQRGVDLVEQQREPFGAAARPHLLRQRSRQRREAGDVGKERRAHIGVRQVFPVRQGAAPVLGNIGAGKFREMQRLRCDGSDRPPDLDFLAQVRDLLLARLLAEILPQQAASVSCPNGGGAVTVSSLRENLAPGRSA
jgi:hypothetical protein